MSVTPDQLAAAPKSRVVGANDLRQNEAICDVCDGFGLVPTDLGYGLMDEWAGNVSQCVACDGRGYWQTYKEQL